MDDTCFACFSGMCMDHEGGFDEPQRPTGCSPKCIISRTLYADMAIEHIQHKVPCGKSGGAE